MKNNFRIKNNVIKRTCKRIENDYNCYLDDLIIDFHDRCGYCDTPFNLAPSREIDHFIPQSVCKYFGKSYLINSYDNLVLSCVKCNRRKSAKCSNNTNNTKLENNLFYDPGVVDFNKIFYRNEFGMICSDDKKGKTMISELRLHNPIYTIAWFIEMLDITIKKYDSAYGKSDDIEIIKIISMLKSKEIEMHNLFVSNYQFLK